MLIPAPGTPGFEELLIKARKNPSGMEAKIVQSMAAKAQDDAQSHVRGMLQSMIDLVPGQLFRDIARFHAKFDLPPTEDPGYRLSDDMLEFRLRFLLEELREYAHAVGFELEWGGSGFYFKKTGGGFAPEKALDGLVDLVYVALGTAFLHRFPYNEGWDKVQQANMAKEKATGADDDRSTRKHKADIVKPAGWLPPDILAVLNPYARVYSAMAEGLSCCAIVETADKAERCRHASNGMIQAFSVGAMLGGRGFDRIFLMCKVPQGDSVGAYREKEQDWFDTVLSCRLESGGQIIDCSPQEPLAPSGVIA